MPPGIGYPRRKGGKQLSPPGEVEAASADLRELLSDVVLQRLNASAAREAALGDRRPRPPARRRARSRLPAAPPVRPPPPAHVVETLRAHPRSRITWGNHEYGIEDIPYDPVRSADNIVRAGQGILQEGEREAVRSADNIVRAGQRADAASLGLLQEGEREAVRSADDIVRAGRQAEAARMGVLQEGEREPPRDVSAMSPVNREEELLRRLRSRRPPPPRLSPLLEMMNRGTY